MNNIKNIIKLGILPLLLLISSCSKEEFEPYDNPFFHIMVDNKGTVDVLADRKDKVDYKIYLSAELQFDPIDVQYEITIGNGLKEGVDFDLITKGNKLIFPQGIFERPITIQWKESVLDPTKNNSIVIRLISNSKNYTMGLPGPDELQRQLVITKK
jgi:hypothetical protein